MDSYSIIAYHTHVESRITLQLDAAADRPILVARNGRSCDTVCLDPALHAVAYRTDTHIKYAKVVMRITVWRNNRANRFGKI